MKKLLLTLSTLFFLASCGGNSGSSSTKLSIPPSNKIYFGAFPDFGGSEDIVTKKRIKGFESITQQKITWAVFSDNWFKQSGISYPKDKIHTIYSTGFALCAFYAKK